MLDELKEYMDTYGDEREVIEYLLRVLQEKSNMAVFFMDFPHIKDPQGNNLVTGNVFAKDGPDHLLQALVEFGIHHPSVGSKWFDIFEKYYESTRLHFSDRKN